MIRELLVEAGADLDSVSDVTLPEPEADLGAIAARGGATGLTRELYGGYQRNYSTLLARSTPPYILHEEYYKGSNREILYEDPGCTRTTSSI